jgi:hypothetical protein
MGIGLSRELPEILRTIKKFPNDKVHDMLDAFSRDGE